MKPIPTAAALLGLLVSHTPAADPAPPAAPAAAPLAVTPIPLTDIRLTGGPLKHAQDLDAKYLLDLDPDRLLSLTRTRAGLPPKAPPYGGWDGDGKNLTGHILGHYLSAVSLMYAATGDTRFRDRANTIVAGLREVANARHNGYLGALADGESHFNEIARGEIRSGGFDLNGMWSPWYVLHKTFAGLRDAWRYTGNRDALDLESGFAAWAESIVSPLDDARTQRMLATEFGGMNEVLADLYHDTGDARWLALSHRFDHHAVIDPLVRGENHLAGLHGNTQVPKLSGCLARHLATGDPGDLKAASFFWDQVATRHSFATGGHGKDEYFNEPDHLSDHIDGRTAESCNVYNMQKMARTLFSLHPDERYAAFLERALFNHVLGSIDPHDGSTCYMVPAGRGVTREYQRMFEDFTCCVGSGMENHALHAAGTACESGDTLWINLYIPNRLDWKSHHLTLATETSFPDGDSARIQIVSGNPTRATLRLRRPQWAGNGFAITINGNPARNTGTPGSYVDVTREWKPGDHLDLTLPKALHLEPLPDNPDRAAILWGPLVLAGDLGPDEGFQSWKTGAIPVLVTDHRPPSDWLHAIDDKPGHFRSSGVGREQEIDLLPFHQLHHRTYAACWDFFTTATWNSKAEEYRKAREAEQQLARSTVAFAQPGEMQPERDFHMTGEETSPDRVAGRPGRRAKRWFAFDLPVDPASPCTLVASYCRDEWSTRNFTVTANGRTLAHESRPGRKGPGFDDIRYPLPTELTQGAKFLTIRFQADPGSETAAVFGLRIIRSTP